MGQKNQERFTKAEQKWWSGISAANRQQLVYPPVAKLKGKSPLSLANLKFQLKKLYKKSLSEYQYTWTVALNALGAEWGYRRSGNSKDLQALKEMFARNIDQEGNWITPLKSVGSAMKGYSLLYLTQLTDLPAYQRAAKLLVESLVKKYPRVADGSLPYNPRSGVVLVDTLAMVSPFLARYARQSGDEEARELAVTQLKQFIRQNIDPESHLPYHGYYVGGPLRLGLQGWGRGTGWYMLGLIDTLLELDPEHPDYEELKTGFLNAANSLHKWQREDGHWSWVILQPRDKLDSSTTSLVGYSLLRAEQEGILSPSFQPVIKAALEALVQVTRSDGILDLASAECKGLGKYPQIYQPQPWLQGAATAFAALYLFPQKETIPNKRV